APHILREAARARPPIHCIPHIPCAAAQRRPGISATPGGRDLIRGAPHRTSLARAAVPAPAAPGLPWRASGLAVVHPARTRGDSNPPLAAAIHPATDQAP